MRVIIPIPERCNKSKMIDRLEGNRRQEFSIGTFVTIEDIKGDVCQWCKEEHTLLSNRGVEIVTGIKNKHVGIVSGYVNL